MNLLQHKTEKLVAVAIAHDGYITPYARVRNGAAMSDRLALNPNRERATEAITFTSKVEPGNQAMVSLELGCWRPSYPFVNSFFIGERSDWPFGEGDLPQVGATSPGTRDEFNVTFDPVTKKVSWQNTNFAQGSLTLDSANLPMIYVTLRLFRRETTPQAQLKITGSQIFNGKAPFRI